MTTPSTPDPHQPQPSAQPQPPQAQPPQAQSPPDGAGAAGTGSSRSGSSRPGWLLPVVVGVVAIVALCCTGSIVLTAVSDDDQEPDAAATGTTGPTTDDDATDASARPDDPDETEEREEPDEAEEPEPEPDPGFGAGVWEVGDEIPSGTYVTTAGDGSFDSCYWARLAGFSGDFEDIIANDNLDSGARGRLTIAENDAGVEFSGSCRWVEVAEAEPVDPGDEVGPGTWAVGDEVAPGTYVTETGDSELTDSCYWARLSGFSGEFDDLIANDNLAAGSRGRIEIASSDAGVTFSGGCTWTRN